MKDWVIQLALGVVISIFGFFLKNFKSEVDKQDEKIEQLKTELHLYKLAAADHFVLKDDFIRATAQTDRKLDKIYDEIIKLSKQP